MILVLGASSQIGYFLLRRLSSQPDQVLAISRRHPPSWAPVGNELWLQYNLDEEELTSDARVLIAAGPLRHALKLAQSLDRLTQVIAFSSSSVETKVRSRNKIDRQTVAQLQQGERELHDVCARRGINLSLFRPTLIYGCGLDRSVTRVAHWLQQRSWIPLAWPANGLRQPVHADDLAAICLECVARGEAANGLYALGGGETLTYRAMIDKVAAAIKVRPKIVPLPARMLSPVLNLLALLPYFRGLNGAMIRRQNQNLLVQDKKARQHLNWRPRAFTPVAADFESPAGPFKK